MSDTTETETVNDVENDMMAGKYLTFTLGDEEYGLPILTVQRIIQMQDITSVPKTPAYVLGVINLRGKIIPVIEVRNKFQMESIEPTDNSCIVVVQVPVGNTELTMGLLIDAVSEVVFIDDKQMQETPDFGEGVQTEFITSMAKIDEKVVMLLDIEKILSIAELQSLSTLK
ncbi:MAG: chemotaxis protein CheW [Fibrobacterales bacterium]